MTTTDIGLETNVIGTSARAPPAQRRVALVTCNSRGLGSAIARRLDCDGLAVAVTDVHGGTRA